MKICIRPHDIGKMSSFLLGEKIHQLGFQGVQLAIAKAIEGQNGNPDTLTPQVISSIKKGFSDNQVEIPLLGAYFNPVHSNKEKVKTGAEKFADHLKKAPLFGAKYVASETGSYNDEPWIYHPKNQTEEALQEVVSIFKPLTKVAEENNTFVTLEGAWNHCIYSPKQMKGLIDQLDSPNVRVTVDLFNYLYEGNYENRYDILQECFDLFSDKIVVFHIKDFNVIQENGVKKLVEVGLGKGLMGWDTILPQIQAKYPNAILVFEGVKDLPDSIKYFFPLLKNLQ